jgi:glutamyl-tRNA reductase
METRYGKVGRFVPTEHPARRIDALRSLSISHHELPAEQRRYFAVAPDERAMFYRRLRERIARFCPDAPTMPADPPPGEVVLLSTCNRTALFLASRCNSGGGTGVDRLGELATSVLAEIRDIPVDRFAHFVRRDAGTAVQHLFELACGLDSAVLGETQILQQLKDALFHANEAGTTGPLMHSVFHGAFKAARRAHAETRISAGNVSAASAGVALAAKRFGGRLVGRRALLIGAGGIGRLTVKQLVDSGAGELVIANRTPARAEELVREAQDLGLPNATAAGLDQAVEFAANADVVISAISADGDAGTPNPRLKLVAGAVAAALVDADDDGPRVIVDLGLPPLFDLGLREVPHLDLIGIDDLGAATDLSREARLAEVPKVEAIITAEREAMECPDQAMKRGVLDMLFRNFADAARREAARTAEYGVPTDEAGLSEFGLRLVRKLLGPVGKRIGRMEELGHDQLRDLKFVIDAFGLHPDETPRDADERS